jgi:hypothetical protein
MLGKKYGPDQEREEPWGTLEFTLQYSLLANWNEVYGIEKKNNHWKEITLENQEFVRRLYEAAGLDYRGWTDYRNYVNELRHDFVLFPDPYHHSGQEYDLGALQVSLAVSHQWMYELVSANEELANGEDIGKWPLQQQDYLESLERPMETALASYPG